MLMDNKEADGPYWNFILCQSKPGGRKPVGQKPYSQAVTDQGLHD